MYSLIPSELIDNEWPSELIDNEWQNGSLDGEGSFSSANSCLVGLILSIGAKIRHNLFLVVQISKPI